MMPDETVERIFEMELKSTTELQIISLLDKCFPNTFEGRSYYKQVPHTRLLLWRRDALIGHVGLDHRVIRVGNSVVRVVGIIDLCIDPEDQHQRRGSELLQHAERLAGLGQSNYTILFADRDEIYLRNGYISVDPAMITWLAIDELASHSMQRRDFSGTFMIKEITKNPFPNGDIDLLGYLF